MEGDAINPPPLSEEQFQGLLLGWGSGEFAQHGQGTTKEDVDVTSAKQIDHPNFWHHLLEISCGASHTAVITDKFEAYTWGNGNSGQLGCGDKLTHPTPQKVVLPSVDSPVIGVACGGRHTVWWTENGKCYSSGNNFYAQLGYDFRIPNYKENQSHRAALTLFSSSTDYLIEVKPHLLRPLIHHKVIQVACGEKHSLFLFESGLIAGCGCNDSGQVGTGKRNEVLSPKVIEDLDDKKITVIACGPSHSLAVTDKGELFAWGSGKACGSRKEDVLVPLRKFTRHSNIVSVAGGSSHSMALSRTGTVYTWGGGSDGQLGFGEGTLFLAEPKSIPRISFPSKVAQIACGEVYSAAVTVDGQMCMWGKNCHVINARQPSSLSYLKPITIQSHYTVREIACGAWHAIAITGKPAWQPETADSSHEDSSEDEVDIEELEQELRRKSDSNDSFVRHKKDPRSTHLSKHLSLAEFYAPTPLPAIRPISQLAERRASVQSCASAIIPTVDDQNSREIEDSEGEVDLSFSSVIKEEKSETLVEDEQSDLVRKMESLDLFEDENARVQYSRLSSSSEITEAEMELLSSKKAREKLGKGVPLNSEPVSVSSAKSSRDHTSLTNSLVRAKSFPVFHNPNASSHTSPKVVKLNAKGDKIDQRRATHPKLPIYSKQNVTLKNADIVMDVKVPQTEENNSLPAKKMMRAHTFYGKMLNSPSTSRASKQARVHRDSRSQTYFEQVIRSEKMTLSPLKNHQSGGMAKEHRGVNIPSVPRRKATFSSASSWKKGDEHRNNILISSVNQKKQGGQGSNTR